MAQAAAELPYFKNFGPRITASGPQGLQIATVDANLQAMRMVGRERGMPTGYDQVLDDTDLQYKYEGISQPLLSRSLSAALLNARGIPLIGAIAPLFPTSLNNFTISNDENYEIPFQLMESHGVPVITGHRHMARTVALQPYKRAAEVDLQGISDARFGAEIMQRATGTLGSSALLTVCRQISIHLVWTPFRHMSRAFYRRPAMRECARQLHFESHLFALGNTDPAAFVNAIRSLPTNLNNCDKIIVPQGMGRLMQEISTETRPLPMYQIALDPVTAGFVELLYEGPNSLATFTGVDGRRIDVLENPSYYMLHDEPEHKAFQSLRSFPVLGELILQPHQAHMADLPGDPKVLTTWVHSQTPESINQAPLEHAEGIKWMGVWNNINGTMRTDNQPGDIYPRVIAEIVESYGDPELARNAAQKYFASWNSRTGRDNNTPDPEVTQNLSLTEMKSFREFTPFVTRTLEFPALVGDTEPRMLPNEYLERDANCIIDVGARKLGMNPGELRAAFDVWNQGDGANVGGAYTRDMKRLFDAYLPDQTLIDLDALNASAVDNPAQYPRGLRASLDFHAGESLDDYVKSFPLDALRAAPALQTTASPFTAALAYVPSLDAPLRDYLTFAFHAQSQLAAAKTPDTKVATQKSVDSVLDTLRAHAGKSTAAQVLAKVAEELRKPDAQLAALPRALISARDTAAAQPLGADAKAFERFAAPARAPVEARGSSKLDKLSTLFKAPARPNGNAMDIDAPMQLGEDIGGRAIFGVGVPTAQLAQRRQYANDNMDTLTTIVFLGLCGLPNSWHSHAVLAQKLGIALVRLNFARPFQRYRMLSVAACRGGGATYKTAIGSTLVNTSFQGVQGYIQLIASFRMAILPLEPAFTALLPHVLCDGFIGGVNTNFVRTPSELMMVSPQKPSVIAMPVPIDETQYHFPVHALNGDIYPEGDTAENAPLFKHSGVWHLLALAHGSGYMNGVNAKWANWDFTSEGPPMSLAWHRSHVWFWDTVQGRYVSFDGTGPRGLSNVNDPEAARIWAGHGSKFDKRPPAINFSPAY